MLNKNRVHAKQKILKCVRAELAKKETEKLLIAWMT